jgi:hypothetical protein
MKTTYREEKSIKDLALKDIIRMGRNDYYYNEDHILTMTRESPDSRTSRIKRQEERRLKLEQDRHPERPSAREVWIRAGNSVNEGDVVVYCEDNSGNVEVLSRAEFMRRELEKRNQDYR